MVVPRGALLTLIVGFIARSYFPPVNVEGLSLLGPKVTLISVMIALGIVRYNHFYTESKDTKATIEKEDFGLFLDEYIKQIKTTRAELNKKEPAPRSRRIEQACRIPAPY